MFTNGVWIYKLSTEKSLAGATLLLLETESRSYGQSSAKLRAYEESVEITIVTNYFKKRTLTLTILKCKVCLFFSEYIEPIKLNYTTSCF